MQSPFHALGASDSVVAALARRGITEPFPIQSAVLRDALDGRDVVAQSPTGSGKTLAFAIPLVERATGKTRNPEALVLVPTRELAAQVATEIQAIAGARQMRVATVVGGVGIVGQGKAAARSDVVVATPGRLEDLVARRLVRLDDVSMLVLDEVDRMLDVGFKPAVERIVALLEGERQTLLFSATLDGPVGELAAKFTRNPVRASAPARETEAAPVEHRFLTVEKDAKLDHLVEVLEGERGLALVFVRTKHGAGRLAQRLERRGVRAVALHGDMSQNQRTRSLDRFTRGHADTLVATDVAARGLDVDGITHVVNFDPPDDDDTYVHRVGRTGRAGKTGTGVTFVLDDQRARVAKMAAVAGIDARCERTREYLDDPAKPQRREPPRVAAPQGGGGPRRARRGPAFRGRPRR